jgi:hypothetical protein
VAEQNKTERATTVALYTHGRGAGAREYVTRTRDTEDRATIVQQGRGERLVIRPAR